MSILPSHKVTKSDRFLNRNAVLLHALSRLALGVRMLMNESDLSPPFAIWCSVPITTPLLALPGRSPHLC